MSSADDEIYLTTEELSRRIKHAKQTLYNSIHGRVFQQGVHFIKPSRRKILWIWSEIEKWLGEKSGGNNVGSNIRADSLPMRGRPHINI